MEMVQKFDRYRKGSFRVGNDGQFYKVVPHPDSIFGDGLDDIIRGIFLLGKIQDFTVGHFGAPQHSHGDNLVSVVDEKIPRFSISQHG
jgi:hypothetical protein